MSWCQKCRNEYVEGIKVCADCGAELTDTLQSISPEQTAVSQQMEQAACQQPEESMFEDSDEDRQQEPAAPVYKGVYQSNEKKAEENRSSAYMLLIIGGAGLVFILLFLFDIINIALFASNKYMVCGGMGCLFLLFLVMGAVSLKSSKTYEQKAKEENNLTDEMKKWCEDNLTREVVEKDLFETEEEPEEEIKYFRRTEKMKSMLNHQFLNLEENFLDAFVDEYYQNVFD